MATIDVKQIVLEILETAKIEIQENMATEGINASGETSASLTVTVDGDLVRLSNENKTHLIPPNTVDRAGMFHVILPILYTNGTRTKA